MSQLYTRLLFFCKCLYCINTNKRDTTRVALLCWSYQMFMGVCTTVRVGVTLWVSVCGWVLVRVCFYVVIFQYTCLCVCVCVWLTTVGLIGAVLAVWVPVTALPVRDAVRWSVTQELTLDAVTRGGRGDWGAGGHWSQGHVAIGCFHGNTM